MAQKHPQFNLADRVVSWFSPGAAVRRAHARSVLAYYEAAKSDRLRKGRRETGSGNDAVLRAGSSLRQIARHLEQNYDLALGVLNTLVNNVVGAQGIAIEPQPRNADGTINQELAAELAKLWKDWTKRPEVTKQHDWGSACRMLCRSWMRDGEVFAQMVSGRLPSLNHGTKVPFSFEMLEADYVPMDHNVVGSIVQGVQINAWGEPVSYTVYKANPTEGIGTLGPNGTKQVPAARMRHLKTVHRIRQVRGTSVFSPVLNRFDDLKDYEESERIAAKIAASMAAVIKKGNPDLYMSDESAGPRHLTMRPGMIFDDLKPGESVETIDTNRPNPNLETYRSGQLKAIAAGTGPTFSSIARSYDGTYSSQRQELVEGYGVYGTLSAEFVSRIACPFYEEFVAMAIASGVLRAPPGVDVETLDDALYISPSMPWIDPKKEADAMATMEDRCYVSGPENIRKRGGNPADTLAQQAAWLEAKRKAGVASPAPSQSIPAVDPIDPAESDDGDGTKTKELT